MTINKKKYYFKTSSSIIGLIIVELVFWITTFSIYQYLTLNVTEFRFEHPNILWMFLILVILNIFWAFLCIGAYFITEPNEFYVAAALVGLVMGGIQALSRSTFSKFLPQTDNTTSFFSFYDVAQKVSIVLGMILFGTIDQITDKKPRDIPNVPLSLTNDIIFLDSSGLVLIL